MIENISDLLAAADAVLWNTNRPQPEPGLFLVFESDLEALRVAVAKTKNGYLVAESQG